MTLHAIWPFLWIWSTLWRKERGWGFQKLEEEQHDIHLRVDTLIDQVSRLEQEIAQLKAQAEPANAAAVTVHEKEHKQWIYY